MIDVLLIVRRLGPALLFAFFVAILLPPPLNQLLCTATVAWLISILVAGMLRSAGRGKQPADAPPGPVTAKTDPWAPPDSEAPSPTETRREIPDDLPRGTAPLPAFTPPSLLIDDDPHTIRVDDDDR
jgi:hypothetical protein